LCAFKLFHNILHLACLVSAVVASHRRPPEGGFGLTVWRDLEILAVLVVGMLGIVSSVELD
jgi:hypothetical protein